MFFNWVSNSKSSLSHCGYKLILKLTLALTLSMCLDLWLLCMFSHLKQPLFILICMPDVMCLREIIVNLNMFYNVQLVRV